MLENSVFNLIRVTTTVNSERDLHFSSYTITFLSVSYTHTDWWLVNGRGLRNGTQWSVCNLGCRKLGGGVRNTAASSWGRTAAVVGSGGDWLTVSEMSMTADLGFGSHRPWTTCVTLCCHLQIDYCKIVYIFQWRFSCNGSAFVSLLCIQWMSCAIDCLWFIKCDYI